MDASKVYGLLLPDVPKAPAVPESNEVLEDRPSGELDKNYKDAFKTYLHRWVEWENKVIDHFEARCFIYAIRDSETQWYLTGDDREKYLIRWLQDSDLLRIWHDAHKVHGQRVAKFKDYLACMSHGEFKGLE
ncbi:hypothetical protein FOFC_13818 [Fusarium oxysporum]|nr:hypothetical protein FOFC_13818 [Fusarium oxysporum]